MLKGSLGASEKNCTKKITNGKRNVPLFSLIPGLNFDEKNKEFDHLKRYSIYFPCFSRPISISTISKAFSFSILFNPRTAARHAPAACCTLMWAVSQCLAIKEFPFS